LHSSPAKGKAGKEKKTDWRREWAGRYLSNGKKLFYFFLRHLYYPSSELFNISIYPIYLKNYIIKKINISFDLLMVIPVRCKSLLPFKKPPIF